MLSRTRIQVKQWERARDFHAADFPGCASTRLRNNDMQTLRDMRLLLKRKRNMVWLRRSVCLSKIVLLFSGKLSNMHRPPCDVGSFCVQKHHARTFRTSSRLSSATIAALLSYPSRAFDTLASFSFAISFPLRLGPRQHIIMVLRVKTGFWGKCVECKQPCFKIDDPQEESANPPSIVCQGNTRIDE